MSSFNHLSTEQRYWKSLLEPMFAHTKLLIDVMVNYPAGTVLCKIVHPNHVSGVGKHPELVSIINVDRKKRKEADIMKEIEEVVAEKAKI